MLLYFGILVIISLVGLWYGYRSSIYGTLLLLDFGSTDVSGLEVVCSLHFSYACGGLLGLHTFTPSEIVIMNCGAYSNMFTVLQGSLCFFFG